MLASIARLVSLAGALLVKEPSFGTTVNVVPSAITVIYGRIVSGGVSSLTFEDGTTLRMSRFTVPNNLVYPITLRIEAYIPSSTAILSFSVLSRKVSVGAYSQSLNLYNWTTNLFDPNTNVTAMLQGSFTTMDCSASGDVSRYVRASDRKVMALVRVRPIGPTPVLHWETEYDRTFFVADSGP